VRSAPGVSVVPGVPGVPNDVRSVDLALFLVIQTHSSCLDDASDRPSSYAGATWRHTLLPFLALRQLRPERPWFCAFLSILFALSPSSISVLYTHDQYQSFYSTPFVPVAMVASVVMARGFAPRAAVVLAACMAIQWMIHALTGFFMGIVVAMMAAIGLVLRRASWNAIIANNLLAAVIFLLFTSWYFVSMLTAEIFSLGLGGGPTSFFVSPLFVQPTVEFNRLLWPGAFLPVDLSKPRWESVQIGYALIAIFLASLIVAVKTRRFDILLAAIPVAICLIMLLPIPYLTKTAISFLPSPAQVMNFWWMYQRLYKFVAAGIIVAAAIAFCRDSMTDRWWRPLQIGIIIGLAWSTVEAEKIVKFGFQNRQSHEETENLFRRDQAVSFSYAFERMIPDPGYPDYISAHYDPVLFDRIVNAYSGEIAKGNRETVVARCLTKQKSVDVTLLSPACSNNECAFSGSASPEEKTILRFTLPAGARALISFRSEHTDRALSYFLHIRRNGELYARAHFDFGLAGNYAFAVESPAEKNGDFTVSIVITSTTPSVLGLKELCVGSYRHEQLPVRPISEIPYVVFLEARGDESLETRFNYVKGFRASVDDVPVDVSSSLRHRVLIRLNPGEHIVRIFYDPPIIMKFALAVTSLSALLALFFVICWSPRIATAKEIK
jgi:hypothetical protein